MAIISALATPRTTMPYLLLDDARAGRARLYRDHIRRETLAAADIDQLDTLLARGWADGLHAALRIPYEFGLALMELAESAPPLVLDWYARLDHLHGDAIDAWLRSRHDGAPAGLLDLCFDTDRAAYARTIAAIHEHIRAGNTYQVNYTLRATAASYGSPVALYQRLRALQPAPYAALAWHPADGHTLCLSPELFLARDGDHLHTLPMKGTARAAGDIAAAKAALARDPKNRAENTMIVDLLRNDLSKIARPHGVSVSDAFHVAQHGEVLQMTSRVNAHLRPGTTHAAILRAAYPCGSITGAPKRITMQTIAALETSPRDLYTGALGYIEPDKMRLNVAIRTLQITDGHARIGVGSGITIDSDADDEYRECQLKAAFLRHPPDIGLIETLRVADGVPQQLDAHLARLAASARALGLPCDAAALRAQCMREITANMLPPLRSGGGLGWGCEKPRSDKTQSALLTHAIPQIHRLKITLQHDGTPQIDRTPLDPIAGDVLVLEHCEALPDRDLLRRHKSTHRAHLDRIWQAAVARGAFDALLYNQSGELLEGARSSVFLQIDGAWHTPPLTLDILPGIARARILANPALIGATHIAETRLSRADVARAETILLTNSLRGILTAHRIA